MLVKHLSSPWVWLAWTVLSLLATLPALLWHLDSFATYGPRFRQFFPLLVPLLLAGCWLYQIVRKINLWRYEPLVFGGLGLLAAAAYQPRAALVTLCICTAAFVLGHWSMGKLGFSFQGATEELALSSAVGLHLMISALFLLGLMRLYYPVTFLLLLGLPGLLLLAHVKRLWTLVSTLHVRWSSMKELRSPPAGLLVFFSAVLLIPHLAVVLSPSLVFDSLAYHLAGAKHYALSHGLTPLPFQPNSYLPQGFEVLMAMAYALGGQPAAQMISPLFFLLALATAFALARKVGIGGPASLAGVALVAMLPLLHWEASAVKNDFALALFLLCALHACLRWQSERDFRWIYLSAFFLASAFGIKPVALFAAIPLVLIYLVALRRRAGPVKSAAALAALFLVAGSYWNTRTLLLTGDPLYPYSGMLGSVHSGRAEKPLEKLVHWLQTPWRAQFDGNLAFDVQSRSPLGPWLVCLLPVWLLPRRLGVHRVENLCLFFAGLYLLGWSLEWGLLRYAIAPLVLLILFTADRLVRLYQASGRPTRAILVASLFYGAVVTFTVVTFLEINSVQLRLFTRQLDWAGYLRAWTTTYRPLEYLDSQARPGNLILSVDNCAAAYTNDPASFHGICNDSRKDLAAIRKLLDEHRYSFLILPHGFPLDPGVPPSYQDPSFQVYRLAK